MQSRVGTKVISVEGSVSGAFDTTGTFFPLDSLPQVMTYGGPSGELDTVTAGPDSLGQSFRQTYTYTNGSLTNVSGWVKL